MTILASHHHHRKHIMKTISALILSLSALSAQAWTGSDSWTTPDKTKHLAIGAGIGLVVSAASDSWRAGAAAGCAVGIAKELQDGRSAGRTQSYKDAAVTCLGAAVGAYAGVSVAPVRGGVSVFKSWAF